ncbi:hypothetical protein CAPN002_00040 [Capnocytophaga stomatis]|uniref:hypothetical protein n=1 Tax=Capnocytophaga stomatis TaxID=1848904 RepID=UPI00194F98EC|nr:hypothetical protein [Capnocytophaga stomatis]GIJ92786.1 hypothetical protein CAPN002_00040 [Capnocytophaga stomatis]
MKNLIVFMICIFFFCSCEKKEEKKIIKSPKGGIDIVSNIYFNASKNLDDVKSIIVSKINYKDNYIIEIVPEIDFPEIVDKTFLIKDSLFFDISNDSQILFSETEKKQGNSIHNKTHGAMFSINKIPNYEKRKNLNDTILFEKKYKRFEISSKENHSVFYIYQTDTILPYAICPKQAKEYFGRIERIDSYNKTNDIFISSQLIPRNNWDSEALDIFEFNEFAKKRNNTAGNGK